MKIKLKSFYLFLFVNVCHAQNTRIDTEYDEGFYRNPNDFWINLASGLIQFIAPYYIASKEGDDSGISYWKWWFIFFGVFVAIIIVLPKSTDNYKIILISYILLTIFGLNKSSNTNSATISPHEVNSKANNIIRKSNDNIIKIKENNLKFWYVASNKIWHKKLNEAFEYKESHNGKTYIAHKINESKNTFSINKKNIDQIVYDSNFAIVHCPKCDQKCRVPLKKLIEIICPKCEEEWLQNLEIKIYDSNQIIVLINQRVAYEFSNKQLRDSGLWFECYKKTKNLDERNLIYKVIREKYLIKNFTQLSNYFTIQEFDESIKLIPNMNNNQIKEYLSEYSTK